MAGTEGKIRMHLEGVRRGWGWRRQRREINIFSGWMNVYSFRRGYK
jgi:hypothetical protein